MQATVEQLPEDKVRVSVEVPQHDLEHAVDHAASDLAESVKIPGFRKGKVPMPVLLARVGRERLMDEAISSHIGGWFRNAVATARIMPVAQPEYEYDLPDSAETPFRFTATVAVQPKVEAPDWTGLEVPREVTDVPGEVVDAELENLRQTAAELAPVESRPAQPGDVVVVDVVSPSGEARHDVVIELGAGRMVDELEDAMVGMEPGQTKAVEHELADETTAHVEVTLKEIKEKVLPPLDDELARAVTEFDTLADLRTDIEETLLAQLEAEVEAAFRSAVVAELVRVSGVKPAVELVRHRAGALFAEFLQSLERRGVAFETYLAVSNQTAQQVQEQFVAQAAASIAGELVLDAVAEKLALEVSDEEIESVLREQGESDETIAEVMAANVRESIREDLRLRRALDRVAADVKPISVELAQAREKLWTPGQENAPGETTLWTPGGKE